MENIVVQDSKNLHNRVRRQKLIRSIIYYVCGTLLAVFFLFPLIYMIATSTKSESSYAADAGSIRMFLLDFENLSAAVENYGKVFTDYGIWRYAVNSVFSALVK